MKNTTNTELDYKLLTKLHDDLSKLASRIAWRQENLALRMEHLKSVFDHAERKKLNEGIKRSESVLNSLVREYNAVSSKLVVGRSEQLVCVVPDCKNKPIKDAKHGLCGKHIWPNAN